MEGPKGSLMEIDESRNSNRIVESTTAIAVYKLTMLLHKPEGKA